MARDLQGVLDAVLAGLVVVDRSGRVELVNGAACRILGTSAGAAAGQTPEALVGAGHRIAELLRGVLADGRDATAGELRIDRRLAGAVEVEASVSPLFDAGGECDGAVLVLRDRTLQRQLQEQAQQRDSLAALAQIAAGIAHEVKNPLGGIRGAAEILGGRAGDPRSKDAAALVVREVDRIAGLLDDLMVFARGDALRLGPVNIHRVLDGVLDLLVLDPLAAGVDVERAFDPSLPELWADADRLTQVFLNLARNALQAMEGRGGTLRIETRMPLDRRLSGAGGEALPAIAAAVADTGPGLAPEVLRQIETPFFTTRPGGTGLGLAVARHWVSRHGGSLRLESRVGAGTVARVTLPLRRPPR